MRLACFAAILAGFLALTPNLAECAGGDDSRSTAPRTRGLGPHRIAISHPGLVRSSSHGPVSSKSATDTFYIYGGPGTFEGQFQTQSSVDGGYGGAPDPQGWTTHDLTEHPSIWRAGTTNAESVGDGNPQGFTGDAGNHAAIAHHEGTDYVGYGNNWDEALVFRYDLSEADPAFNPATDTTTVHLICEYKLDLEPFYDWLWFEFENSIYSSQQIAMFDGSSYDDSTGFYVKREFDSAEHQTVIYAPGDYFEDTKISLRIRATSDGGWSDEDGLFLSHGRGAAAIDNIRVFINDELVSFANWEPIESKTDLPEGEITGHDNGAGLATKGWQPDLGFFVGDFAKLIGGFEDIDPCRDNRSWCWSFINDGTPPNNCPECSILPATSPTWSYGVPGGYVVEHSGGLTPWGGELTNEIWSPPIAWDLPGTEDDAANGGLMLGYSRWSHLPLQLGIFAIWQVRSHDGVEWTEWKSNNFVYYGNQGVWKNLQVDLSHLIPADPVSVQLALGVVQLHIDFGWPPGDATPAPVYDNVYLKKYRIGGPVITARIRDLAGDSFPVDGSKTGSCRFDASINTSYDMLAPADSIVATIIPRIPGTELSNPTTGGDLVVAQLANPAFAPHRLAAMTAVGGTVSGLDPQTGWDIYTYRVPGRQILDQYTGEPAEGRYSWDLPDGTSNGLPHIANEDPLFFPGDVVHYYLEATDDQGNTATLPHDLIGFRDFTEGSSHDRAFVVRMLPSLKDGLRPKVLFWNDAGHSSGENEYLQAFRQNGMIEGKDYDTYTTRSPSSFESNGLGSAGFHGATASQLEDYEALIYVLGNLHNPSISDGTNLGANDLSQDLQVLEGWASADADRYHAYFGDNLIETMTGAGSLSLAYVNSVLGVELIAADVSPAIEGQTTPGFWPTGDGSGGYVSKFVSYGGCLLLNDFDHITPYGQGPVVAHEFTNQYGIPYPATVPASVEWRRIDGNGRVKHTIVFPYGQEFVRDPLEGYGTGLSARARLLDEIFSTWGKNYGGPAIGVNDPATPPVRYEFRVAQNHPNPFNPRTRIEFSLPQRGEVRVSLYNVRGERIAVLLDEIREAGPSFVDWNGRDARGAEVSSGIYLYKVEAAGQEEIKKMALIR